jgi:ferredoxin
MIRIDEKRCDVCGTCAGVCAADAVTITFDRVDIDHNLCVLCRACISVCPLGAVMDDENCNVKG